MDRRCVFAVMIRPIGMGAEMNRPAQCGKREIIATTDIEQHVTARRRIARPDRQRWRDWWRDVVDHLFVMSSEVETSLTILFASFSLVLAICSAASPARTTSRVGLPTDREKSA
jgi:hypothetical protein